MKDTVKIELDRYEIGLLLNAIREFRNIKLKEDVPADAIDDLYIKVANVYQRRFPSLPVIRKDYAR